jgi:hypothetical protein
MRRNVDVRAVAIMLSCAPEPTPPIVGRALLFKGVIAALNKGLVYRWLGELPKFAIGMDIVQVKIFTTMQHQCLRGCLQGGMVVSPCDPVLSPPL